MTDLPLQQWREWSKTDDRLERFVLSDIRQMLGEIERLRAALKPFAAMGAQCNNLVIGYVPSKVVLRGPAQPGDLPGEWVESDAVIRMDDLSRAHAVLNTDESHG